MSKYLRKINKAITLINTFDHRISLIQNALGRIESRQTKLLNSHNIHDYEFQVFSQAEQDGLIQYLINKVPIKNKVFVEFGVENYRESNTRFLLQNNKWSG